MNNPLGGSYKEVIDSYADLGKGHGYQAHHVYSFSAYSDILPISKGDGPAIRMDSFSEHKQTASWGSTSTAKEYQQEQKGLIEQGSFREAWMNDVKDIQSKFGDKYDTHLAYAEGQLLELDKEKKIQLEDKFKDEIGERQKTLEAIEKNQKDQLELEKSELLGKQDVEKQEQLKQEAEKLKSELREQYDKSSREKSEIEIERDSKIKHESPSLPEQTKDTFSYDEFEKDEFESYGS